MNSDTSKILYRHLYWCSLGLTLEAILEIKATFKNTFSHASTRDIERFLMIKLQDVIPTEMQLNPIDFTKITFLYIEDEDFDGDIEFISQCNNITHIYLDGWIFTNKIKSLEPFRNLNKLEYLNLSNNAITNLEALSELTNLKHFWIYGNKLDSIQPITHLKKLKELRCTYVTHKEVYKLLQNSIDCKIEYKVKEEESTFGTTRVDALFFNYNRQEDFEPSSSYIDIRYYFTLFLEIGNHNKEDSKIQFELLSQSENMVKEYITKLNTDYNSVLEIIDSYSEIKANQYIFSFKLLRLN